MSDTPTDVSKRAEQERADARTVAHAAVLVASAWAATHLEASSSHQRLNFGWNTAVGALVGRYAHGVAAGVRLADLHLVLLREGALVRDHPAGGVTPDSLLAWMREQAATLSARDRPLSLPDYPLPPEVVRSSPLPVITLNGATSLSASFARAAAVLSDLGTQYGAVSGPRCWPRDFDVTLGLVVPSDATETVEVSFFHDDGAPSWGVWPSYEVETPTLSDGRWQDSGRIGAVLPESALPEFGAERTLRAWLGSVLPALLPRTAPQSDQGVSAS